MKKSQLRKIIRETIKEQALGLDDLHTYAHHQIDTSDIPPTGVSVIAAACEDTQWVPGTISVMNSHTMPTCLLGMSSVQVGDVVMLGTAVPYPPGSSGNTTIFTPINQTVFVTEVLGPCTYINHGARLAMDNSPVNSSCQKCCSTIDPNGHWLNGALIGHNPGNVPILASGACFNGCSTEPIGTIHSKMAKPDDDGVVIWPSKSEDPEINRMQSLAKISKK